MWKIFNSFCALVLVCVHGLGAEQQLEIALSTKKNLKPLYMSKEDSSSEEVKELYALLAFDLERSGLCTVVPYREEWEKQALVHEFDYALLQREKLEAFLVPKSEGSRFELFLFCKESLKKFSVDRTGNLVQDRGAIHAVADAIVNVLTGREGVASQKIIFSERVKGGGAEWLSSIWMCDWDGANAKRLTSSKGYCMTPGFFNTGGFYFVSSERGQSKIYRQAFSDEEPTLWVSLRGNQMLPALSRDESLLAYITDLAGRPDLFIQSVERKGYGLGKPRQLFSFPRATQASPTFSPDGRKICFVSNKEGSPKIYLMEIPAPNGKKIPQPKLLTKKNRENSAPAWSPDGKRLAYSARNEGCRQIWIFDFDSGEEWPLTTGDENKENPAWAPDSLHLVYNSETGESSELFVVDLNNQEPHQITFGLGQKRFASWGRMR